jgi:hypothetical protein
MLTVTRLGVTPTLARSLRSTNPIESMLEICRDHSTNVKHWRDGKKALRLARRGCSKPKAVPRRQRLQPAQPPSTHTPAKPVTPQTKITTKKVVASRTSGPSPKIRTRRHILGYSQPRVTAIEEIPASCGGKGGSKQVSSHLDQR